MKGASHSLGAQAVIAFDIGLRLAAQDQGLRGIKRRPANRLAVDQSVQKVQHMGLGRDTLGQGYFHGNQHGLFIVLEHQGEDLHHLPIATSPAASAAPALARTKTSVSP